MDSFEEWAKLTTQHACIKEYADRLIDLGASWDSFLSRDAQDNAKDLIAGGIPALAAHTIVQVATTAAKKSQSPMAIFWDIENMPIPSTSSGRDVSSRLKSILKPYGNLVQFRGYASIGLSHIPQQKRSDLQLSGCLLVDCPHNGRKDVADKMIIVDAMNFAMQNPAGATLCFVTGDVDFSYLLAVLQRYKQYRTIVISTGTLQSMLDVNCDMKMRWETDILQLRSRSTKVWADTSQDLGLNNLPVDSSHGTNNIDNTGDIEARSETFEHLFEPLTEHEEWIDDVEFLRNLVRRENASSGLVLKSLVGNVLRQTNPARFPHREAVQTFLSRAIADGVVTETGEGVMKQIHLPFDETSGMLPAISLSSQLPVSISFVPIRVKVVATTRPYIIFIKWKFCPSGTTHPTDAFVQNKEAWGFFLFQKLVHAQRTVSEHPWLRNGILINWRNVGSSVWGPSSGATNPLTLANPSRPLPVRKLDSVFPANGCALCRAIRDDISLVKLTDDTDNYRLVCPECKYWEYASADEKKQGAEKAVEMLEFMASNDDILVAEKTLRRKLHLKEELDCSSRKFAALWIASAINLGTVQAVKAGNKAKVCLPSQYQEALKPFPPDDMNTSKEIAFIESYLWNGVGWASRTDIIILLKKNFPESMFHAYHRSKVLLDGHEQGRLFVGKNSHFQVVAISDEGTEVAFAALSNGEKRLTP